MKMVQSASSPCDGETMLVHAVMVILKQPTDGPLSKALARGGIHTVTDILALSQSERDALTYHDVYGNVRPLAIGHKNLLRMLKAYAAYCEAKGSPIVDWMTITKKDFDDFRHSQAGLCASEWYDIAAPATVPVVLPKSSLSMVSVTTSVSRSACCRIHHDFCKFYICSICHSTQEFFSHHIGCDIQETFSYGIRSDSQEFFIHCVCLDV